ncbi:MAG: T9SS type A sorting domain-containing protein, partial [Bacteroidales bacterium]|nr:T9SS type A sorting domain-containing protein [Bacteroidales bacterium]
PGVCPGTYSVTIRDANGLTTVETITVTSVSSHPIEYTVEKTCFCDNQENGSITINMTDGHPEDYTFHWNYNNSTTPTLLGLNSGRYTVTIMNKYGCTKTETIQISQCNMDECPTMTGNLQFNITDCEMFMGCSVINDNINNIEYFYLQLYAAEPNDYDVTQPLYQSRKILISEWDPSKCIGTLGMYISKYFENFELNELVPFQTYNLRLSAKDSRAPYALYTFDLQNLHMIDGDDCPESRFGIKIECAGSTGIYNATCQTNENYTYTYLWSNGAVTKTVTNLTPGIYSVVITNTTLNKVITNNFEIPNLPTLQVSLDYSNGNLYANISGGKPNYQSQWTAPANNPVNYNTFFVYNPKDGLYTITVTDYYGCEATASFFVGQQTIKKIQNNDNLKSNEGNGSVASGIEENNSESSFRFSVFPNPTTGRFYVNVGNYNNEEYKIQVMDIMGRVVYEGKEQVAQKEIDLSNQPKGMYFVRLIAGDNVFTEKIVRQ